MDSRKLPIHFMAIDGLCQYELREMFGISEISLPNIAVYLPTKKKGARLVGTFNNDDIISFIEGILRGKLETFDINKLTYVDRDCESIGRNSQDSEDDEILQEILREAESGGEKKAFAQKGSDTKRGRKKKSGKKSNEL